MSICRWLVRACTSTESFRMSPRTKPASIGLRFVTSATLLDGAVVMFRIMNRPGRMNVSSYHEHYAATV